MQSQTMMIVLTRLYISFTGRVEVGGQNALLFASDEMVHLMNQATVLGELEEPVTVASDGTFKVVPKMFHQLLTICVIKSRHVRISANERLILSKINN